MKARLKLLDGDMKVVGSYTGINPDANPTAIGMFVEGVNGLRAEKVSCAKLVTETTVYEAPEEE